MRYFIFSESRLRIRAIMGYETKKANEEPKTAEAKQQRKKAIAPSTISNA